MRAGTPQDNMNDKTNAGRQARGEKHGRHKLTNQQIIDIYLSTDKQYILAKKYGVDDSAISYIKSGKRSGWLKDHKKMN